MIGTLYGVGVGPGDPELLTMKAVRIIKECDGIALPATDKDSCFAYQIAKQAIPNLSSKPALCINMPMTKDKSILAASHRQGADKIEAFLKKGADIAFLTLGDPTIYSTFTYLQELLTADGFQTEIICGIPSFCAASGALNTSLAKGSEPIHILPGSYPLQDMLKLPGTKVLMKSGKRLAEVKAELEKEGLSCQMVENCGTNYERIYYSIENMPDHSGYYSLIIAK